MVFRGNLMSLSMSDSSEDVSILTLVFVTTESGTVMFLFLRGIRSLLTR